MTSVKSVAHRMTLATAVLACLAGPISAVQAAQAPAPVVRAASGAAGISLPDDRLYVGTCYQPVDRTPDQIRSDIAIMKAAGLQVVRMGDLSWDSFQPAENRFEFAWFDMVMDEMQKAGIKVILDLPGLPAPVWLHKKYPGSNIVNQSGAMLPSATRYMEDISDPDYVRLANAMAARLTQRYAAHPALIAIGYNNEIGNGYLSYSDGARLRFVDWLKTRYGTVAALNTAWATQRWSRRIGTWDEVVLPNAEGGSPPERYLDLYRFWSDQIIARLKDFEAVRQLHAPTKPAISNFYDSSARKGFDYLASYRDFASHGAMGFYPSSALAASFEARMMRGGSNKPIWFNEFTTGQAGYYGARGRMRMWAYMGLIDNVQGILAWTFNTHHGGEEQAWFGLRDHDGTSPWKMAEFSQIGREFGTLQKIGFPRRAQAKVAVAYSYESRMASAGESTIKPYFKTPYIDQVNAAYEPFFRDNVDVDVVNLGYEDLSRYKLVVVAGDYIMDARSAQALRAFVSAGGTVVMTAYSAKADERSQWFDTPLPGRLSDVFGLTTSEFYDTEKPLRVTFGAATASAPVNRYEVLRPTTARAMASFDQLTGAGPAVTINRFGKGQAIYLATPAHAAFLTPIVRPLYQTLGIERGPVTPDGVQARKVDGRTLYVNSTTIKQTVRIAGKATSLLTAAKYDGVIELPGYGVELVQ